MNEIIKSWQLAIGSWQATRSISQQLTICSSWQSQKIKGMQ
jgi:hypothetical protein